MAFSNIQSLLIRSVVACALFLSFSACSGFQNEELIVEEDCELHVEVPETFTPTIATKLGKEVDSLFTHLHKRKGFNGTVLVTKYDQIIYRGAFGYADFKTKDTLSTQTVFQLASVSKQFTAMAIMMLKERGKLSYDDSLQVYIPDFPYKGITVRQLLTHRSGLPNYTYFSEEFWPDRKVDLSNDDVLSMMAVHKPNIYYQPDRTFSYSNTGYALLASVVEKASGQPFAEFMREHIFEPLKMHDTYTFNHELVTQTGRVATGHIGGRRKRLPDYQDTVLGDKGMYSTVEDLYKWDQALYTQKLVKRETLEEAFMPTGKINKRAESYGFGFRLKQVESGDTVIYHGGLWHGFNTYFLRNPKDHSSIIVLSNLTNGSLNYMKDVRNFMYPAQPKSTKKQVRVASAR
ncbi:serine hydrolase domain-containing protein [Pontibacter lucknowensis]|uniref:CubicO group peptidase, beta-lactamase class C family n=1 Tax=Pontibacter lucknowensis TaxID=1077936 RepID=A0A1N7AXC7_9BACT|nr:serine hydrolase domain-containing protein [Pontibacter lucknowensis]SIR43662.1 CubicO group peptidase, beta-lactamase class C family [Pontibacter lucknowensis]